VIVEFSRRKFLMAAGGTALALPVLEALTPPKQARAAVTDVRRMIFIVTVNGSPRVSRPSGQGTGYTLGPILSGLEKHRADMLYVAGLDSKAAVISNGDPHATGFATTLSGMKCLPGDEFKHGACFMDANCAGTGWGDGPSLDQIIAKYHLDSGVPVVHGSLNFAVKNCPGSLYTRMSYTGPGQPVVPEADPSAAFDRIFGGLSTGTGDPAVLARIRARQASVLDELDAEIVALQGRVSSKDRERLEAHLTGIRDLELRIARMQDHDTGACTLPPRSDLGPGNLVERNAGGMETNVNADKTDNVLERNLVWQQMAIAALACDLTRVVTIMTAPSRADTFMPWLKNEPATYTGNFDKPHHAASHDDDRPTLTSMDHWYATRVSSYVDDLKSTLDFEGRPLFERTGVAWFNELGEGPDHSHHDKPHVIIGSMGGFFKTGQLVRYPNGTPHNVLLTAIAQAMGIETDHIGGTQSELRGGDVNLVKA
jgi:hypothetical protein